MEDNQQPIQPSEPVEQVTVPASIPAVSSDKAGQSESRELLETVVALITTKTFTDAAVRLGIARSTLYEHMDKYGIRDFLGDIPRAALDSLRGASLKAALNLVDDLNSNRPKLRQDASKYILDKALPPPAKVEVNVNTQNNTFLTFADFMAEMVKRKEAREGTSTTENL